MKKLMWLAGLLFVAVVLGGTYFWMNRSARLASPVAPPSLPASEPNIPQGAASSSTASSEPVTLHPIEPPSAAGVLNGADIGPALVELLGQKAVTSLLQTDDFARRFVATVDNLGRQHVAPMLWPIHQTQGRFTTEARGSGTVISADNGRRYTPFVLLVETVDIGRAVDLYVRMYPLLQQAYQDLGYPKRYFNDRLIEVIDQLLAAPDAPDAIEVTLTEVKGPVPSVRPWVRYEFADPALEALSAGQKIMVRVGPVNQRRLKATLVEIRRQLVERAKRR